MTTGFLQYFLHNTLALARRQQAANLEPLKSWKCPTQSRSALLPHPMGGQKPDQSCLCPLAPVHRQSPWPPCPKSHTTSLGTPPAPPPTSSNTTVPGEARGHHTPHPDFMCKLAGTLNPRAEPAQMPSEHNYRRCCGAYEQAVAGPRRQHYHYRLLWSLSAKQLCGPVEEDVSCKPGSSACLCLGHIKCIPRGSDNVTAAAAMH